MPGAEVKLHTELSYSLSSLAQTQKGMAGAQGKDVGGLPW